MYTTAGHLLFETGQGAGVPAPGRSLGWPLTSQSWQLHHAKRGLRSPRHCKARERKAAVKSKFLTECSSTHLNTLKTDWKFRGWTQETLEDPSSGLGIKRQNLHGPQFAAVQSWSK